MALILIMPNRCAEVSKITSTMTQRIKAAPFLTAMREAMSAPATLPMVITRIIHTARPQQDSSGRLCM